MENADVSQDINELRALFEQQQQTTNQTIQTLLSSVRQIKQEYMYSLSCVPVHPYEKLKQQFIPSETKPLLIEEIKAPENFCIKTSSEQISAISCKMNERWSQQMCSLTSCTALEEMQVCNAFASLSENTFVVDSEMAKNHLQFIEMIKNIPIQLIEQQPKEVAEKIISQFITIYRK